MNTSKPELDSQTARVRRQFRKLLKDGATVRAVGGSKDDPDSLVRDYMPRCAVRLFDATYYLSRYLYDDALGFFVGFLVFGEGSDKPVRDIYPRIFYKDSSLMWRAASHYVDAPDEYWVGKGDVRWYRIGDDEYLSSVEETTNLPYEVQAAFDTCSRASEKKRDDHAIARVVRRAPPNRIAPYADFTKPRRENTIKINRDRRIARFLRPGDPSSLKFTPGFEPDLDQGIVDRTVASSHFFGGEVQKFRVLSSNRKIQYMFFASPTHAWLNPPQALTRELSTYGVRLVDIYADEDLFVPGYEYHDAVEDGASSPSQIPEGFAGDPHPENSARSDASKWVEALPVIKEFRKRVLKRPFG